MSNPCPKDMRHGPCGGVHTVDRCEVDGRTCPFIASPAPSVTAAARFVGASVGTGAPVGAAPAPPPWPLPDGAIVVDVRAPASWTGDDRLLWRRTAAAVPGCVALLGEHVDNPARHEDSGRLAPDEVVAILADAGVQTIVTVTGRERDQAAAVQMVERYRRAGATAVHCVTGDHPAALGIDRPVWFGTESMRMLAGPLAAGVPATVAESPAAPGDRPARLAAKRRAGASACILNHGGDVDRLVAFADRCRAAGADLPLIAPVPMVADRSAAQGLAAFPGIRLPSGFLEQIVDASAPDDRAVELAATLAAQLHASGRFAGVNLSGGASGTTPEARLAMTQRFVDATRDAMRAVSRNGSAPAADRLAR